MITIIAGKYTLIKYHNRMTDIGCTIIFCEGTAEKNYFDYFADISKKAGILVEAV